MVTLRVADSNKTLQEYLILYLSLIAIPKASSHFLKTNTLLEKGERSYLLGFCCYFHFASLFFLPVGNK